jgi:hypothetical protein
MRETREKFSCHFCGVGGVCGGVRHRAIGVRGFKESAELLSQSDNAKVTLFFGFAMVFLIFFHFFFRHRKNSEEIGSGY